MLAFGQYSIHNRYILVNTHTYNILYIHMYLYFIQSNKFPIYEFYSKYIANVCDCVCIFHYKFTLASPPLPYPSLTLHFCLLLALSLLNGPTASQHIQTITFVELKTRIQPQRRRHFFRFMKTLHIPIHICIRTCKCKWVSVSMCIGMNIFCSCLSCRLERTRACICFWYPWNKFTLFMGCYYWFFPRLLCWLLLLVVVLKLLLWGRVAVCE